MKPSFRLAVAVMLALAALASACGSSDASSPIPALGQSASASARAGDSVTHSFDLTATSSAGGTSPTPHLSGTPAIIGQPVPNNQEVFWCRAGTYSQTQSGTGTIEGMVEFKGGTYCKIVSTTSSAGVSVSYSYYYNQDSSDVWTVLDINGQVTETHLVNGNVTSQSQPGPVMGEWCAAGTDLPATGGVFGRLEGIVDFKDGRYCKAIRSQTLNGQTIIYTYYFKQDGSDVWMVTDANGNIIETHMVGG